MFNFPLYDGSKFSSKIILKRNKSSVISCYIAIQFSNIPVCSQLYSTGHELHKDALPVEKFPLHRCM